MLRTSIFVLLIASFVYTQLILDENDDFGRKIIVKIMQAINIHEEYYHQHFEFVKVVSTLGSESKYTAYVAVKNSTGTQFSCTAELLAHGESYEIGRVICSNDEKPTNHPFFEEED